jgi:hypothetical protein
MGLDVYLSYYKNYHQSKANEKAYEEISDNLWEAVKSVEGDELTEDSKKRIWSTLEKEAGKLGLDKYGCDITYRDRIENDSAKYPEHYFKVGYFRSSYNGSGINSILKDLGIPDLYDIFQPEDEYEFSPNWSYALDVVQESIKLLKKDKGYRVEAISANMFSPDEVMKSPQQALKVFNDKLDEMSKSKSGFNWFSNRDGHFYLDNKGLQVHALLPGKDFMQRPCTFAVYKLKDGNKYYLQALEIVKETIEYVLKQEDPQAYYLSWSG